MLKIFLTIWLSSVLCLSCAWVQASGAGLDEFDVAKPLPVLHGVGGDFSATGSDGTPFKLDNYQGKVILLFFGYTNCADICPFTLGYLKQIYKQLTPAEQRAVQVVFVTIDPEYDTAEHLHQFVQYFNKDFIGVTGDRETIDRIVRQYKATYNKISGGEVSTKNIRRTTEKAVANPADDAGSLYGHTVNIYLIDGQLRTRSLDFTGTPKPVMLAKIRQLIAEQQVSDMAHTQGKITRQGQRTFLEKENENNTEKTNIATSPSSRDEQKTIADFKSPEVLDYWVKLGPPNARVMAAYGEFVNSGNQDIVLTGIESKDFYKVELHETRISGGMGKMIHHPTFLIPAGKSLKFEPGKNHIMLINPLRKLHNNDITAMTLHFQLQGGEQKSHLVIEFPVAVSEAEAGYRSDK